MKNENLILEYVGLDLNKIYKTERVLTEKEREKISQRTKEGLQARKEAGVVLGRPRLNEHKEQFIIDNYGKIPNLEIVEKIDMKMSTFTHILRRLKNEGRITAENKRGVKASV